MFRVGDKVTQLRNNYDKGAAGVFNGTTGVVTGMSPMGGRFNWGLMLVLNAAFAAVGARLARRGA